MVWSFLGIALGVMVGFLVSVEIPVELARYSAVILLGMADAIFGAFRAEVARQRFSAAIFISGVVFNILLAVGITALGDQLGLDLYLAATIVFTFRIFSNLGIIRRTVMQAWVDRRQNRVHARMPRVDERM